MRHVTVVIPALNEERHIEQCVTSLLEQLPDHANVIVADGGSTDRTRECVAALQAADPRVSLIDNPRRTQSAAVNLVAKSSMGRSQILIRADAHAAYPDDFLSGLISAFDANAPASVVVPMTAEGSACFQRAAAAAQNSRLGNGGSAHRHATSTSRYVEHGHHALFDLAVFNRMGGYDEDFRWNEDAEFDQRLRQAGERIWMCTAVPVTYFPRSTPLSLALQYYRHGLGRAQTITKHGLRPRLRQQLPVVALAANLGAIAAAPLAPAALLIPAGYVGACMTWGALLALRHRDPCVAASGFAAMIMHMSWAAGSVVGRLKPGLPLSPQLAH